MKYTLTDETKECFGVTLHRVKYENGEIGGWLEKESNLDQDGDARVSGDALVYGNARVYGDAQVYGDAWVSGNAWVYGNARVYGDALVSGNADWMLAGPIGSRDDFTTIFREKDRLAVSCGCFYGSLDKFAEQVDKNHGDNEHGKAYRAMIDMVRIRFGA